MMPRPAMLLGERSLLHACTIRSWDYGSLTSAGWSAHPRAHWPHAGRPQKEHGAFPLLQRVMHMLPDGGGKRSAVAHLEQI